MAVLRNDSNPDRGNAGAEVDLMAVQGTIGIRDFTVIFVEEPESGIVFVDGGHCDPRRAHNTGIFGDIGVERRDERPRA